MGRLLILTIAIVVVIGALIVTVRSIGATHEESPIVVLWRIYQCSPQPCWHNIRSGVTTMAQAKMILLSDSTVSNLREDQQHGLEFHIALPIDIVGNILPDKNLSGIEAIIISPVVGSFHFSDAIVLLGQPVALKVCGHDYDKTLTAFFDGNILTYLQLGPWVEAGILRDDRLTFDYPITNLEYEKSSFLSTSSMDQDKPAPWRGFTKFTAYPC